MLPKTFVLALTLLLALPLVGAQAQEPGSVEVWDTDRTLTAAHVVHNDTTLIIRGAVINLDAGLIVGPRGKLVLESGPDGAAAVLKAGRPDGWAGAVLGTMIVDSAPGSPAVLDGIAGRALVANDVVLYEGGFKVVGNLTGQGLVVRNYTAGIGMGVGGVFTMRDVTFESANGIAVVGTLGRTDIENGTFRGAGAAIWNVASGHVRVANSTFEGQTIAVAQLGNETILENVTVKGPVVTCVRAAKGVLVVRGLECHGFTKNGVEVTRPMQGAGRPIGQLSGLRLSTNITNGSLDGVLAVDSGDVSVSDSEIGPVPGNGIQTKSVLPVVENVTFRGVGGYNVYILNPGREVPREGWGGGETGQRGRLYVGAQFFARASDPEGKPAAGARLEVRLEPSEVAVARATLPPTGESEKVILDVLWVDREGKAHNYTYHVMAEDHEGKYAWERKGYVPDGDGVLFRLVDPKPQQQTQATPFPGPLALLGVLVAVAALGRLGVRKGRI